MLGINHGDPLVSFQMLTDTSKMTYRGRRNRVVERSEGQRTGKDMFNKPRARNMY
jgi:hypothetical protein